jgi:hypothetical protein
MVLLHQKTSARDSRVGRERNRLQFIGDLLWGSTNGENSSAQTNNL